MSRAAPMLKRPLTRRYAPTSPRKRGEVNPHKLLPKKSRANIPESRHSVSARSSFIPSVCCESQFLPGTALLAVGRVAGPNSSFGPVGWGEPQRKPCLEHLRASCARLDHPGLHFRTMLRIAVVRPTLPTNGGGIPLRHCSNRSCSTSEPCFHHIQPRSLFQILNSEMSPRI